MIGQQSPILVAETGEHLVESRIQRQSPERKRKKNVFNSLGPGGGGGRELFRAMDQEFRVLFQPV